MKMRDSTNYLQTLSPEQIQQLYKESQLDDGAIDSDYVAGYWAMWAGWTKPTRYEHAARGWLDAIRDAADQLSPEIYTVKHSKKQIVVYSGTQGEERHIRHFQKTGKGSTAAERYTQRLIHEGYTFVEENLFDMLISHGTKKEAL